MRCLPTLLALLLLALPARADELARRALWDGQAALELALRLELGLGMPMDGRAAATQLCRAAALGSQAAAQHLAAGLLAPEAAAYDPAAAAAWLRFAQARARGVRAAPPPCPDGTVADRQTPLAALATELARDQGLDPLLVKAVIATESAWRTDAVSSAGAQGLMQLMPGTGRRHGVTDAFDAEQNLRAGIRHLAEMLRSFGGDEALALAAYNAGEARVRACRCVPALAETTAYVRRVLALASRPGPSRGAPASRRTSDATGRGRAPPG